MLICNAVVFDGKEFHGDWRVRLEGGQVTGAGSGLPAAGGEEVLDLGGDYLLPGFVDVHIHACAGMDTMRGEGDIRGMSRFLYTLGVAAFCPTTMSAATEDVRRAMDAVRRVMREPEAEGARVLGAHMEAPFLSAKHAGAQRAEFFRDPDWDAFLEMAGDPFAVRLITLAPERKGSEAFIRKARAAGVRVSVGHTDASAEQVHRAGDWGADHITHTFNAQTPLHHRNPGVPGAALTDGRFFCEVICDGKHLHDDAVRLLVRCAGAGRAVAITDAMEAAGMPDGEYALGGQKVIVRDEAARLEDGTLAGSVLTMPRALENLILRCGIAPETACAMCTSTPAESVGENEAGRIRPGSPAPLTRWSRDWRMAGVVTGR